MSNKRVSELSPITAIELNSADLLLLSDVGAQESKKLMLSDLGNFLLNYGNFSGSFNGTSSYSIQSLSASYAPSVSSSYALVSGLAYQAVMASSASLAATASYLAAIASSSYASTASYALTYFSTLAQYASTASYLLLVPGQTNGSASYALTASYFQGTGASQVSCSYASSSTFAQTASYFSSPPIISSSWASSSLYAVSASYAAAIAGVRTDYGVFLAISQSVSSSQLDMVAVTPTNTILSPTEIEVYGNVTFPISNTGNVNGAISLIVLDRSMGVSASLDNSPIQSSIPLITFGNLTAEVNVPFTLIGEIPMYGLYEVYISASNGVFLDTSRTCRFKIVSDSNFLSVTTQPPIVFHDYPTYVFYYYTASAAPFIGSTANIAAAGSSVTEILLPAGSVVQQLYYTWTLSGLTKLTTTNNPNLLDLGGVPPSMVSMSVSNCGLTRLPTLAGTSVGYLDCSNNSIQTIALSYLVGNSVYNPESEISPYAFTNILALPPSMSYLNCANNPYLGLPSTMPYGLIVLIADGLNVASTPSSLPNTVQTMSFGNCSYLSSCPTLPTSLTYFDCHSSLLAQIPTLPTGVLYCDVSHCQLTPTTIGYVGNSLSTNGLHGGTLNIAGNANSASAPGISANIATLRTNGWTVDGH